MAYGIINLNGKIGHSGWQWIFIIEVGLCFKGGAHNLTLVFEGAITVLVGIVSFFFLPDSPDHARFLNDEEKFYVKAKLKEDGAIAGDEADGFSWPEVAKAFTSVHVLIVGVIFFFSGVVLYSLA
jgi:hypothetical protein